MFEAPSCTPRSDWEATAQAMMMMMMVSTSAKLKDFLALGGLGRFPGLGTEITLESDRIYYKDRLRWSVHI